MRKSFKKAVAVVSAIAMVVAGISYSPSKASAADGTELLTQTEFVDGSVSAWNEAGGTYVNNGDGSVSVAVEAKNGGDNWSTQLVHNNLTLTQGKWYTASVTVSSDVARSFQLLVQSDGNAGGNWSTCYNDSTFAVEAGGSTTFTKTFQATNVIGKYLFGVMMGYVGSASPAANVTVSNVSLREFDEQPAGYEVETTTEPTTDAEGFLPLGAGDVSRAPYGVYGEIYQGS